MNRFIRFLGMPPRASRGRALLPARPRAGQEGFTLMEVVIASVLVCLLALCVYNGVSTVRGSARTMADHVAAHGLCVSKFERMKAIAFEDVTTNNIVCAPEQVVLNKLPGFGAGAELKAWVSVTNITLGGSTAAGTPSYKKVNIVCSWDFFGRHRTEEMEGIIVDGYSTYSEVIELDLSGFVLNPNKEFPASMLIVSAEKEEAEDGTMHPVYYDWQDLDSLAGKALTATAVVVHPGGSDAQKPFLDSPNRKIENSKTASFSCSDPAYPIHVRIRKQDGKYIMDLSCDRASFSCK